MSHNDLMLTLVTRTFEAIEGNEQAEFIEFSHNNIRVRVWTPDDGIRKVRLATPLNFAQEGFESLREIAYDLVCTLLSETTNNDPCDVTIRERSAHLDSHPDCDGWHGDMPHVIVDAEILDEFRILDGLS